MSPKYFSCQAMESTLAVICVIFENEQACSIQDL